MIEQILADTHILYWYFEGGGRLGTREARRLADALEGGALFGTTVSLREISGLVARGRLRGPADVLRWARHTAALGLAWLPLDDETAIESAHLPGTPPKDPNDQMIIATARVHDLTLVTRDAEILEYARRGHVRVLTA